MAWKHLDTPVRRADLLNLVVYRHPRIVHGRVLVVDDCRVTRNIVRGMVECAGVECVVACSGQLAVDACTQEPYQLILMDRYMPGLDGWCAVRHIRARHRATRERTRIVGMSADDPRVWAGSDVDKILIKPLALADVHALLRER